jgi:hypothetical protein
MMRVGAENERQEQYKRLREVSVNNYYNICRKLSMYNLETSQYGKYFTIHMKNVIETGV